MEPLSAFSLACNVLQIVETSLRVLGRTAECYKSGSPDEVDVIIGNVHTINGLNDELRNIIPNPHGKISLSSAELRLVGANEQCLRLSGDFIQLLDSLKITKKSVWRSIGISIKSMWYQDKLASFEKAISESRANLTLAFLLLMHELSSMTHRSAVKSTTDVERRILDTLNTNTSSLEAEIHDLTASLKEISIDHHNYQLGEFSFVHQTQLVQLSEKLAQIWEHQKATDEARSSVEASRNSVAAQNRIIESLRFPQMQERKEEISSAYKDTYEWLFLTAPGEQEDWHNFVSWARRADSPERIYWIRGKPGSGKSTLARFVYDRLDVHQHLHPWAESRAVLKAAHFLWSPGTTLQKSWMGMLRSLLSQLLDQAPTLSEICVSSSRWRTAASSDTIVAEWTPSELLHGIQAFLRTTEALLFVLIDGLDELQGDDEDREELIGFLLELATYENIKLCISSRPDNIFQDAFQHYPGLRLECLTHSDIETYVTERFAKSQRIQILSRGSVHITNGLVAFLVDAASGVFLWVRLVVHDLLRAARDGAILAELVDMAHQVPRDLDSYFARFIESIPPEYRKEAACMFQIALYTEDSFDTLHGLRLLDLSYMGELYSVTKHHGEYDTALFNPEDIAELDFRLDTAARRINSRCRGLIECYYAAGEVELLIDFGEHHSVSDMHGDAQCSSSSRSHSTLGLLKTYNRHIGLIHRSLRDYLGSPKVLQQLQSYSAGPFNTKMFLCRARLAQIQSLDYAGDVIHAQLALGLSSYVLSALGTDDMKHLDESAFIATQLRPIVESLRRTQAHLLDESVGWYLSASFRNCQTGDPIFLVVAIDFNLVAYLRKNLTVSSLRGTSSLSILNCILVGSRFMGTDLGIGNRFPNIEVLRLALDLGADPNKSCDGFTVWTGFIQHLVAVAKRRTPPADAQKAYVEAIKALLEYGADTELRSLWFPPGPLIPEVKSAFMPVSVILRGMLGVYTYARRELQACIDLADEKLSQAQVHY